MYPTTSTTTWPEPVPNNPVTDTPLLPTGTIDVFATEVPGTRLTVDVPPMTSGRSVGKDWIQPGCVADVPVTVMINACTCDMSTPVGAGTWRGTRLASGTPSIRLSSTRCGDGNSTKRPAAAASGER